MKLAKLTQPILPRSRTNTLPFVALFALLFVILGAFVPETASAAPLPVQFKTTVTFPANGSGTDSVAIGDLNDDGKPDLVLTNGCASNSLCDYGSVSVLLGNGDGTFQSAVAYGTGGNTNAVAIGDVNGDGIPDLVVANSSDPQGGPTAATVGVMLGNGDGTFQPVVLYNSGGFDALSVAVADVNGDGKLDLVVANQCSGSNFCATQPTPTGIVGVLQGNGDGTFQPVVDYSSGGCYANSVAVGDVNGDGKPDLLVSNQYSDCGTSPGVSVLLGNGDGSFQSAIAYLSGGYGANFVAVGDVNGDGKLDLVVANACGISGNCTDGIVDVLLNNGDGTFQSPVGYSVPSPALSVAIGDLNGDGKPDLAVSTAKRLSKTSVFVMPGYGDGTFQSPVTFKSGGAQASYSVAIGDVNGDGRPDIVVADECAVVVPSGCNAGDEGLVGVLLNNFTATTKITLTASPNPALVNQSVTFTATIASTTSVPPNGSTIVFYDHQTVVGEGTTINGVATFTTSFSKAATVTYKAVYSGDVFHKSSSGSIKLVVNP
jgi:hypothetical protein